MSYNETPAPSDAEPGLAQQVRNIATWMDNEYPVSARVIALAAAEIERLGAEVAALRLIESRYYKLMDAFGYKITAEGEMTHSASPGVVYNLGEIADAEWWDRKISQLDTSIKTFNAEIAAYMADNYPDDQS